MSNRFDYVKYDQTATVQQAAFKELFLTLEDLGKGLGSERWREAFDMKCEEAYMCVGKAIRDDQIARNGSAELQEGRGDE
jgi:hypothetical protein